MPKIIDWTYYDKLILENRSLPQQELADKLGLIHRTLKKRLKDLGLKHIKKEKPISVVKINPKAVKCKKAKVVKPKKIRAVKKPVLVKKTIENVFENREININELVKFKLDDKTIIFIRPNQDPEAIKLKFLNRRI